MGSFAEFLGQPTPTSTAPVGRTSFADFLKSYPQPTQSQDQGFKPITPEGALGIPQGSFGQTNTTPVSNISPTEYKPNWSDIIPTKQSFTQTAKEIGSYAAQPFTGAYEMYAKPSQYEQSIEKSMPNVPVVKQLAQAFTRTTTPMVERYGELLGGALGAQEQAQQAVESPGINQRIGKQIQPTFPTNLQTQNLNPSEVVDAVLASANVGILLAPMFSRMATDATLKVADAIKSESKVPLSYSDMQKITSSTSAEEAISRVGQDKYNAFLDASKTDSVKQALKQGYVQLSEKQPNTYSEFLRKAATQPLSDYFKGQQPIQQPQPGQLLTADNQPFTPKPQEQGVVLRTSTDEPFNKPQAIQQVPQEAPITPKTAPETAIAPKPIETPIKPTLPTKTAGVAKSIEAKAIEQGLVNKGFDNLAQFEGTTFKEQAQKVSKLMENLDQAKAIVRGETSLPSDMRSAALISAMEDLAKKTKDPQLMYDLANSPLTSKISEGASETSLARMREKDSATMKLQEIKKAREQIAETRKTIALRKTAKSIKAEVNKVNLSPDDLSWDKFLEDIKC